MADALATLAATFEANTKEKMEPIRMQSLEILAHCYNLEEEVDDHPWYYDILQYIKFHIYPKGVNENNKKTIRRMATGYVLDGEILYKKGKDQVLLRCVGTQELRKSYPKSMKGYVEHIRLVKG